MSNVVEYGYFTTGLQSPLGWYFKPLAYRHFNIDNDEQVIFVGVVQNPGPAYVLRGVLRRPDSTRHAEFRREVGASHPLSRSTYYMSQEFAMKDLKGFPGDWSLELFIDDAQVGAFSFFLGDARAITQARKRRAE